MRHYELLFVADPRLSDDEMVTLSEGYKKLITEEGAEVLREESWGRRRLAYPINKMTEGRYMLFYVRGQAGDPFRLLSQRMEQNEKVLRYLAVRTDRPGDAEVPVPKVETSAAPASGGEGRGN